MFQRFGKGKQHALHLYQEYFRYGTIDGTHPAFNNAGELLQMMQGEADIALPSVVTEKTDADTRKFLLRTDDDYEIETVAIPMQSGLTLCISSQIGCRMGCAFCETGKMGLLRHLSVREMVAQVLIAKHHFSLDVRNIVFMGMGEPFDNYEAVIQTIRILKDPYAFGFGRRHITVSSSGVVDHILRFMDETDAAANLAVSINAPNDEVRNRLMPVNKKFNMEALRDAMATYTAKTGEKILAAYVLIKGVTDQPHHADQLADYLSGLPVKVNLIPYNPQSRDLFDRPEPLTLSLFKQRLAGHGYQTLMRQTHGREIMAACGQLGNKKLRSRLLKNSSNSRFQIGSREKF
jgi:23S rRNA (adenine2503-C2)-methyltransferase